MDKGINAVDGGVRGNSVVAGDDAKDLQLFHQLDTRASYKRGGNEQHMEDSCSRIGVVHVGGFS